MKTILLTIACLLIGSSAFAADLSKLGSMTEYSCIVEIRTNNSGSSFRVKQTCESNKSQILGEVSSDGVGDKAQLMIQIIKVMREKGMHLVSQSNDVYSNSNASGKLMMVFQKRDLE